MTAVNSIFQAADPYDDTKESYLWSFFDENDTGAIVGFYRDSPNSNLIDVIDSVWLDADMCERFGRALVDAATAMRKAA